MTLSVVSHQTRDIGPMLCQCRSAVYDVGPTLNQHWFNVSCLWYSIPSKHDTLTQCRFNVGPPSAMVVEHWNNIESMYSVCWVAVLMRLNTGFGDLASYCNAQHSEQIVCIPHPFIPTQTVNITLHEHQTVKIRVRSRSNPNLKKLKFKRNNFP